jgi:hypothetical protein
MQTGKVACSGHEHVPNNMREYHGACVSVGVSCGRLEKNMGHGRRVVRVMLECDQLECTEKTGARGRLLVGNFLEKKVFDKRGWKM